MRCFFHRYRGNLVSPIQAVLTHCSFGVLETDDRRYKSLNSQPSSDQAAFVCLRCFSYVQEFVFRIQFSTIVSHTISDHWPSGVAFRFLSTLVLWYGHIACPFSSSCTVLAFRPPVFCLSTFGSALLPLCRIRSLSHDAMLCSAVTFPACCSRKCSKFCYICLLQSCLQWLGRTFPHR